MPRLWLYRTNKGRVVYARKPHLFESRDVVRILAAMPDPLITDERFWARFNGAVGIIGAAFRHWLALPEVDFLASVRFSPEHVDVPAAENSLDGAGEYIRRWLGVIERPDFGEKRPRARAPARARARARGRGRMTQLEWVAEQAETYLPWVTDQEGANWGGVSARLRRIWEILDPIYGGN